MPDFRCICTKCWGEMEVMCQEPYEGWQGGLVAPDQGNGALHVSDMPRLANSPTLSGPLSTQTYSDEDCADVFGRGGRGVVPESPTEWFTPLSMRTPDSDKDEDPLSDFELAGKVAIDYGDAGTCDAGAVQRRCLTWLHWCTLRCRPTCGFGPRQTLMRALRNFAALLT